MEKERNNSSIKAILEVLDPLLAVTFAYIFKMTPDTKTI